MTFRTPPAAFLSFALVLASALCGPPAGASLPLSAQFDYEVEERFAIPPLGTGLGSDDGVLYTDPLPTAGSEGAFIDPPFFRVELDGCASIGAITEYRWTVDSVLAGTSALCDGFTFDFTTLGMHTVMLTVVDAGLGQASTTGSIDVADHLIVSLGDSYASGEGVPDLAVGQVDIDAANSAQNFFDTVGASASSAAATLQQATDALAQVQMDVAAVLAAQQAYLNALAASAACSPLDVACIAATTVALVAATAVFAQTLTDVGLPGFDVDDGSGISAALNGLLVAPTMARDDAQLASDAAAAALVSAQSDLDLALGALEATWRNRRCHRSANSAHVLAAQQLAESDPHSSVTFLHLSCSGATIAEGIVGPYDGIDPIVFNEMTGMIEAASTPLPPQIERARELVCGASCDGSDRSVDAFLLSAGGNDVNFADIIETCIVGEPCFASPTQDSTAAIAIDVLCAGIAPFSSICDDYFAGLSLFDAQDAFANGLNEPPANGLDDLPGHYQSVEDTFTSNFGAGASAQLHLIEYPDLTRDETGMHCGWEITQSPAEQATQIPGVSPAEMLWADMTVQTQLAQAMQNARSLHGWQNASGIAQAFGTHGYCSDDPWIVRLQESPVTQGDVTGALHPNAAGQFEIRTAILQALPEPSAPLLLGSALSALLALARRRGRPQ